MPRQRGGAAPRRPSIPPPAPKQQTRPVTTAAIPAQRAPPPAVAQSHPPATTSQGPGLFGQMASTAAGVAVGSTVGHMVGAGISGLFGGGSSSPPATESTASPPTQAQSNSWGDRSDASCDADAKAFRKCMDDYNNDMTTCGWYLEQLKACQSMARNY